MDRLLLYEYDLLYESVSDALLLKLYPVLSPADEPRLADTLLIAYAACASPA